MSQAGANVSRIINDMGRHEEPDGKRGLQRLPTDPRPVPRRISKLTQSATGDRRPPGQTARAFRHFQFTDQGEIEITSQSISIR
jgi:hypothetical protein